jgi:hypothetical protein
MRNMRKYNFSIIIFFYYNRYLFMFTSNLCGPTIVYIGFSLIQILIDSYKKQFNSAFIKFITMVVFAIVLNILCGMGLNVIAWFLVFIPIIMMTIISTLLMKTFGLDPSAAELSNHVEDASASTNANSIADYGLGNTSVKRIDRDEIREKTYDKIYGYYDLSYNDETKYDLSNNSSVFGLINRLINNEWSIDYRKWFNTNRSGLGSRSGSGSILGSRYGSDVEYGFASNAGLDETMKHRALLYSLVSDDSEYADDVARVYDKPENDYTSYEDRYADEYKADGYHLFRRSKYATTKAEMKKSDPDVTDVEIDKAIEKMWIGKSATDQQAWIDDDDDETPYDPNNLGAYRRRRSIWSDILNNAKDDEPCPSNETPRSFKAKTGLNCYEVCPPGKQRDSRGICTAPCPNGQVRNLRTYECAPL